MTATKDVIKADLITAMKSGNTQERDVLRMLDSMVKNEEISKNKREAGLSEEEVLEVLGRAVKQRKDSVSQYKKGNRNDLAEKEQIEIDIISKYLPTQMSEDELKQIIKEIIDKINPEDKSEFGKIMGMIMSKTKGRADGNLVRKIVEENLNLE